MRKEGNWGLRHFGALVVQFYSSLFICCRHLLNTYFPWGGFFVYRSVSEHSIPTSTLFMKRNVISHVLLRSMLNDTTGLVAFQPSERWLCSLRCLVCPSTVATELSSCSRRAGMIDEALLYRNPRKDATCRGAEPHHVHPEV
jgi:hypothetical protein